MSDIGRLAGVSAATASRALSGRDGVNAETRRRVQQVATRLGYQPNGLARSLFSGRSFTVGLITSDSFGRFGIPVMLGAENALGAERTSVFLCDGRGDPIREEHYLRSLLERRVDGILVVGRRTDVRPPIAKELPVPVVYANARSSDPHDVAVVPDDEGGGALAVQALLRTGRRRIAHVTGPERFLAARLRAKGAEATLAAADQQLAGQGVLFGEWSEEWGRQAAQILRHSAPDLEAVFCGSDQIARGMTDAFRDMGVRVPDDVALIGFDNWDVIAAHCRPPLTTVDMNLEELGRCAADSLLSAIEGTPKQGIHLLPCTLVLRESTGTLAESSQPRPRADAKSGS